jgi:uncharacterized coiled-coil protein SlyX
MVNNCKRRRDCMQSMKYVSVLFLSFIACYGVTVNDVQKLTVNNFFGEWSKFLDQVLKEQKEQISDENKKIYQAFIEQAKQLNIPQVTGNKKSIADMQEQMKALEKRMGGETKVAQDWTQLSESFTNAAQPISAENEKEYQALVKQAKNVGIEKTQLDAMEAKMKELRGKFGAAPQSETSASVVAPSTVAGKETKVESAPAHEEKSEPKPAS